MKKLIFRTSLFTMLFTLLAMNCMNAQSKKWSPDQEFEIRYMDPTTSEYFRGNAHIVINHEEQFDLYIDFLNAVKKNNSLLLKSEKGLPSDAFKAGEIFDLVRLKKGGKSIEILDVKVLENKKKGQGNHIKLKYKRVK